MSQIIGQVVFEAWYSRELDAWFRWPAIIEVFFLFVFAEHSIIIHKSLGFQSVHLSSDTNATRENYNLIIWEVELFREGLFLKALDFFLITTISCCNGEYFSIIWLVHKE